MRKCGVLLPISSIPSKYGIGCFSKEAYEFVDFLEKSGQKLWQLLPLGPTGYGDSPYQPFSTCAGNPYFIDLEQFIEEGLLTKAECEACDFGDNVRYVDYEKLFMARFEILHKAFSRSKLDKEKEYKEFLAENQDWLDDYALYMAIKDSFDGKCWIDWDEDIKQRKPQAVKKYQQDYKKEIEFYYFQQYYFWKQWKKLKAYANEKGIEIVGDIPIYVSLDSSDTWANPKLFELDDTCTPIAVSGCPPDAFSATGQLWGNPLYRWDYHKETGYKWWINRIAHCYKLYDIVRIDHFRGFEAYYSIPYGDKTAEYGHWEKGPGYDVFKAMKETIGDKAVIAEDLGFLTAGVHRLLKKSGYPGMKVLLFAFDSREESDYLPHNYGKNCVVYTGTHDNDTVMGWTKACKKEDLDYAKRYFNVKTTKELNWCFIRSALSSVADTAVIPMQDYLGLDNSARMNTPSTLGNNWKWRMAPDYTELSEELAEKMKSLAYLYGRH